MLASLAKLVQTALGGSLPGQGKTGAAVGQKHLAPPRLSPSRPLYISGRSVKHKTDADRLTNRGDLLGIFYRDNQRIPE
jgi:hypothetical protein